MLKAIEECESLNAAAKKLNMSYRAAWGRLKASEDRLDFKLVEHMQGKKMRLTPRGHAILERFDQIEKNISQQLKDISKELNDVAAKNPASSKEGRKT